MEITEIRIKAGDGPVGRGVLAYCSVTIDDALVVHNVKVVRSSLGRLLVCMPSEKSRVRCGCGRPNAWDAAYCNRCGAALAAGPRPDDPTHDLCHPITPLARSRFEAAVIAAYREHSAAPIGRRADH